MSNDTKLSLNQISPAIASGQIKAVELCRKMLERISALEELNAFITVMDDRALETAEEIDLAARRGDPLPPLAGVVIAVKDIIVVSGVRCTAASKILENYVPPYTATAVKRLEEAGAVIIGKTNCDEFAMGSSNENSAFGPVRNPWETDHVPGGSSGGSAVAVAASLAPVSLGTDTGGSIRQPASLCGIVGLKPTYGRVSRYGLMAFGSSLDQIGPFAKTVEDAALILKVIAGHDPHDSTSSSTPVPDYLLTLNDGVEGMRFGVPQEYFDTGLDPQIRQMIEATIRKLGQAGAEIVNISLPHTKYAIPVYYLIATAEASSNLARYDGAHYGFRAEDTNTLSAMYNRTRGEGFGPEVKRRIMLGTYALSAGYYDEYYSKAQKVRSLIRRDFREAFDQCDVIITPTTPTSAFRIGEKVNDPMEMYLSDIYTVTANLAGVPAISVPAGLLSDGLPVGIQLLGKHFDEARLLRAARSIETVTGFSCNPPDPEFSS